MGLFSKLKGNSGGMMNVIRCDQPEYLVWKWRPEGQEANSTKRENAIRYGSSLRVKDGEVAVFVYHQKDGTMQDYIVGPYDQTIKTANFPVLASIVGLAFGGDSPFQAEVYFINLSGNVQVRFAIPYFDVFDPRAMDFAVPIAVRGVITFNITDYKAFIKLNRLINFELSDFERQIKDAVTKYIKQVVANCPIDNGIPVIQLERKILEINDLVTKYLTPRLENDFGVNLKAIDISAIEPDKESEGYTSLRAITADITAQTIKAQNEVNIKNLHDMQRINTENLEESLRVQREEAQRAQRLQSESAYIGAHAIDQQANVLGRAADSLGTMSQMGGAGGGGMNIASMMTGMAMGGAMGNQMAGMVNTMGNAINQGQQPGIPGAPGQPQTPPPPPTVSYMIVENGAQAGPFNMAQLQQLVAMGRLTPQTYVWCQGMPAWAYAAQVPQLQPLFQAAPTPPPMPGVPPTPGV